MQFTNQNTAIIISCRYSSRRLPGKAMLKFGERTAISLLSHRLKKSKKFKKIILATSTNPEDNVLEKEVKHQGLHIFRGELNNVLYRNMMAAIKYKVDYVIRVTGDCPFICGEFIDECIDQIKVYKDEIYTTKGNFPQGIDIELFPKKLLENLNKKEIEKFSRQIILKNIGAAGQKKILSSKVLIVGMGGLGCPVAEFLTRSGIGTLGIADHDTVSLSNIHRQSLYNEKDINQSKVKIAKKKLNKINSKTKINIFNLKLNKTIFKKIIKNYDYIVDGTDNFESKFLINDLSLKYKKFLVTGAISKFDGHIFTFNFTNKKDPCLRCFYQEETISDEILNCEYEGILGTVAGIIGTLQANEVLKKILNIGQNLNGYILILDLLNLNFRKAKINKRKKCLCN